MSRLETIKRKNEELRKTIVSKEEAMQLQIEEDTKLRKKLDMVTHWLSRHTEIAPASLESHMKTLDRKINGLACLASERTLEITALKLKLDEKSNIVG